MRKLERTRPPIEEFVPRAAANVARITEDTLNAIDFPTSVADLVKGTFQAIVDTSIWQMGAFSELLANVAKTVEEFMADNISDNQARNWLANSYPRVIRLDTSGEVARAVRSETAADAQAVQQSIKRNLQVPDDIDDDTIETVLVPASHRKLAQSRQKVLATMVLMSINRIVVTSGRIQASMDFRIDIADRGLAESASPGRFQERGDSPLQLVSIAGQGTVKDNGCPLLELGEDSESEINVEANLSGEVDLKFKWETFPLERFADAGVIGMIQSHTAVPGANKPITGNTAGDA